MDQPPNCRGRKVHLCRGIRKRLPIKYMELNRLTLLDGQGGNGYLQCGENLISRQETARRLYVVR